ncbi:MAG TPA: peptidoglycan DD-metalloendopeptidase family protein [Herbaspirillum sp.]|nr:peptidoglycan DD-metalloendopeptidase family protein [Herbaspirillum sp.]
MTTLRLIATLAFTLILGACSTSPNTASGAAAQAGFYTVAQGDTLYGIARRFKQSVPALVAMNHLKDKDDIRAGQQLRVNSRSGSAGTAAKRAPSAAAVETEAVDVGPAPHDWVWPADGKQTAGFGATKGVEISGSSGQEVRAANEGSVSFVGGGIRGYGNLVIIKHSGNLLSVYAHNKTVLVKEGQAVAKGQKIAEMGDSDSDTVKLYFEIRYNGKPVDPSTYLPPR